MKIDLSQFRETFLQESAEHIAAIESGLLHLKSAGSDDEALNGIFRAAHSIKGGAGTFGLSHVVKFTHVLENLFDNLREHRLEISADLIGLLLRASDVLKELISGTDETPPPYEKEVRLALEKACHGATDAPTAETSGKGKSSEIGPAIEVEYAIRFKPLVDIFGIGSDPLLLLRNLGALGQVVSVAVDTKTLPSLETIAVENCYLGWEICFITSKPRSALDEVFEFVLDCINLEITEKPHAQAPERGLQVASSDSQTPVKDSASVKRNRSKAENSVRVPTEKIDQIIDLVGEMVIAHSITSRLVENFAEENVSLLQESVATLDRYIRELHERTMSVRMLPLGSLFSRFHRLVHDLAEKTGKQIRLQTEGDETEVDRTILEMLGDPLTHVLRNSADHGIETAAERIKAGKNPEGTIQLKASHQAGNILIEVVDDGAGLNLKRIRERAIARNLISADVALTDEQTRLLIFEPGFSTKEEVSDLSGRGVGMDVVRKNVTALNGSISVDSEVGTGTHLRIQLPLTLAIMEGLVVRVAEQSFVIPLSAILETVCLESSRIHNVAGRGEVAVIREEAIPFVRLKQLFGLETSEGAAPTGERTIAVIVEHNNQRAALEIDELLGQQQIVVKSLERNFTKLQGTLGATILGDGRAALILDPQCFIAGRSKPRTNQLEKTRMSLVA